MTDERDLSPPPGVNRYEAEIEIDAPVEAVWKALSEGEEISRWFSFECAVRQPGTGGKIWVSWGDSWQGESRIDVWEPGERLRLVDLSTQEEAASEGCGPEGASQGRSSAEATSEEGGEVSAPLAVDYQLEGRGGKTLLRVVHSGFGFGAAWDDYYDSISRGWQVFLRLLAHYLTRHRGTPRRVAFAEVRFVGPPSVAWDSLLGPRGLAREGSLEGLSEGGSYELTAADGEVLSGKVQVFNPPKDLAVTLADWNDAHLWVECAQGWAKLTLSTWGVPRERVEDIETRWRAMADDLFPALA